MASIKLLIITYRDNLSPTGQVFSDVQFRACLMENNMVHKWTFIGKQLVRNFAHQGFYKALWTIINEQRTCHAYLAAVQPEAQ